MPAKLFKRLFLSSSSGSLNFFTLPILLCAIPLTALLLDLSIYPLEISPGLAMRIMGAGLLSQGELLYTDFWDWTQPIVFELLKYPYMLCNAITYLHLPIRPEIFIPQLVFFLIPCTLVLSLTIYFQATRSGQNGVLQGGIALNQRLSDCTVACLLGLSLTALITRFDFGELQYLLVMALLPWLLLRWYAHNGRRVHPALSSFTGLLAGLAACFDIPFIAVFVLLELSLILQSRRWRAIFSPEWLTFLLTIALYLLCLKYMDPAASTAFWKWTMPLKMLNYFVPDVDLYGPYSSPKRADVLYGLAFAGMIATIMGKRDSLFIALASVMFTGFGIFLLEGNGFSYGLILTIFAVTTTFLCALSLTARVVITSLNAKTWRLSDSPKWPITMSIISLAATIVICRSLEIDRFNLRREINKGVQSGQLTPESLLEQCTHVQDKVTIISASLQPLYPYLLFSGRRIGGYMLQARPMYLFQWLKERGELKGPLLDFYYLVYTALQAEVHDQRTTAFFVYNDTLLKCFGRDDLIQDIRDRYTLEVKGGTYFSYEDRQPHEYLGLSYPVQAYISKKTNLQ